MLSLNDREWKPFLFPEIFRICGGFYNKKPIAADNGHIPFVGATDSNNGFTQFCTIEDIDKTSKTGDLNNAPLEKKIFKGNCIVVTNNGSVGYAYYQKYAFTCSHDVNPLYLKNAELNEFLAKFLITAIEQQKVCFTYVRKWRPMRMRKSRIMLPVAFDNQPDYKFMETYIRQQEQLKIDRYIDYCQTQLQKLGSEVELESPEEKDWKEFFVSEIFTIASGKRLESYNMKDGKTPFIGATDSGNGVTNYISNKNGSLDENVLGVNYNGNGMVISFYHPYKCLFSDDVKRFHLKYCQDNKFVLLFFKTLILQQKSKYNYGYKFNTNRMKRQIIMLPVNKRNEPDYEYMEQYAKNIMIKKYRDYLAYLKK